MNYGEIKNCDIANGEGVRVTLFVSGCTNRCEGCFQPQTWDFNYGQPFTAETQASILKMLEPDYINGLTLLGGEPFEPQNQQGLLPLVRQVKERFPHKNIWAFTGFTLEELLTEGENLSAEYDPKCAWALKNMHLFPVEINTASPEMLLRIPGVGVKSAYRIMQARKHAKLDFDDLKRLRVVLKRAVHFITCKGKFLGGKNEFIIKNMLIGAEVCGSATQLSMFNNPIALSALTGEL